MLGLFFKVVGLLNLEDLQKECEKRAIALIEQGVKLKEFDMRLIARQVIKEALEGKTDEDSVSM